MRPGRGRPLALGAFAGLAAVGYATHGAPVPAGSARAIVIAAPPGASPAPAVSDPLRSPSDFGSIADPSTRSVALFTEAARVLLSPRCLNCHPATRTPTQDEDLHPHVPYVPAGVEGHGRPGLLCSSCHQPENFVTHGAAIEAIPGNPHWALAPASMAWQDKTLGEICRQIKDSSRNGGRSLEQIRGHMATDGLVGWAWRPGPGRKPAPGTQEQFGKLVEAWIETGAACPADEPSDRSASRR
jgi:hypothetical protein